MTGFSGFGDDDDDEGSPFSLPHPAQPARSRPCRPGDHDPTAQFDEDFRCSTCGMRVNLGTCAFDRQSTIADLFEVLARHDMQALVVQRTTTGILVSIRSSAGIGPRVLDDDAVQAVVTLVHRLEEQP
jgi:hypothetical protein